MEPKGKKGKNNSMLIRLSVWVESSQVSNQEYATKGISQIDVPNQNYNETAWL